MPETTYMYFYDRNIVYRLYYYFNLRWLSAWDNC